MRSNAIYENPHSNSIGAFRLLNFLIHEILAETDKKESYKYLQSFPFHLLELPFLLFVYFLFSCFSCPFQTLKVIKQENSFSSSRQF